MRWLRFQAAFLRDYVFTMIIWTLFNLLRLTWRFQEDVQSPEILERLRRSEPVIYAHWHGDEWALLGNYFFRNITVLVSKSRDGEMMARFLRWSGFCVLRGSSSRGGVGGFLGLLKMAQTKKSLQISLAVDGPRGPQGKVKKGVLKLAQELNAPVVALAASASSAWVFQKSWSGAFLPKPFAHIHISFETVKEALNGAPFESASKIIASHIEKAKTLSARDL